MNRRTTLGLLVALIVCSCAQRPSGKVDQIEGDPNQYLNLRTGLKIENSINYGARYTYSDSTDYWIIHIASTITNESAIPIQLELAFANEYGYPDEYCNQKFKIFILPNVFTLDSVTIVTDNAFLTDSMQVEFRKYLKNGVGSPYRIKKIIQPGEKCVIPIGTQSAEYFNCEVIPNVLLSQRDLSNFQACEKLFIHDESTGPQLALGLKLTFRQGKAPEKCTIIQCGQINYTD